VPSLCHCTSNGAAFIVAGEAQLQRFVKEEIELVLMSRCRMLGRQNPVELAELLADVVVVVNLRWRKGSSFAEAWSSRLKQLVRGE
jgi:hypothetical protein